MRKKLLLAALLIPILVLSFFFVQAQFFSLKPPAPAPVSSAPFYVGIEFGYGNASDCKLLIDKVKNYTNLIVLSSPKVTQDANILNETCEYAYEAGMSIIVYFPQSDQMYSSTGGSYRTYIWAMRAKEAFGDKFLGCYIYDEPGGKVLDKASGATNIRYVDNRGSPVLTLYPTYEDYGNNFAINLGQKIDPYTYLAKKVGSSVFTADYGLYWFDYLSGFDSVFAEFGWGNDREMAIAQCRGAARVQNKDWGAIVCWQDHTVPENVMESGPELYGDLVLAYDNGATYAVVFDYAGDNKPNPHEFGILTDEHFQALQDFWNYRLQNPQKHGSLKADTALILPKDYGFGFRNATDKIWGVDQPDNWTRRMWTETNDLLSQYGNKLDIVFDDPNFRSLISENYSSTISWNGNASSDDYPVLNVDSGFGYQTIQAAVSNGATGAGDTIKVKAGIYSENVLIGKSVNLVGENKKNTIINAGNRGSAVRIMTCSNVNITGFTLTNAYGLTANSFDDLDKEALLRIIEGYGGNVEQVRNYNVSTLRLLLEQAYNIDNSFLAATSQQTFAGVFLANADNCTVSDNIIQNGNLGIMLTSSANNTLRNNVLIGNKYGVGVSGTSTADYVNYIDESNTVNQKPVIYWIGKRGLTVPDVAGCVILVDCSEMTVQNLELPGNYDGLLLVDTQSSVIADNVFDSNVEGIRYENSSGNLFRNNAIINSSNSLVLDASCQNDFDSSNTVDGKPIIYWVDQHGKTVPENAGYVSLTDCSEIVVSNLNLSGVQGILLSNTYNSQINNNTVAETAYGINLFHSLNNTLAGNLIANCSDGIRIENSSGNVLIGNSLTGNLKGGITLLNSNNNSLSKNQIANSTQGVLIINSWDNIVRINNVTSNSYGIQFSAGDSSQLVSGKFLSTGNIIMENNFTQNNYGVGIIRSAGVNTIVQNNFFNNTRQAFSERISGTSKNNWDNGREGNYWSDSSGVDDNQDGIGDTPIKIYPQTSNPTQTTQSTTEIDNYPLMQPYGTLAP